jgi:hypothetical protein
MVHLLFVLSWVTFLPLIMPFLPSVSETQGLVVEMIIIHEEDLGEWSFAGNVGRCGQTITWARRYVAIGSRRLVAFPQLKEDKLLHFSTGVQVYFVKRDDVVLVLALGFVHVVGTCRIHRE